MFPDLDLTTLKRVNQLRRSPKIFHEVVEDSKPLDFYIDILTCFEKIIQAYAQKFPEVSDREARV